MERDKTGWMIDSKFFAEFCDKQKNMTPVEWTEELIGRTEGSPQSGGKTALLKYWRGGDLTRDKAIRAKCCDCMGYHSDGQIDCEMPHCPLFPFRPYKRGSK